MERLREHWLTGLSLLFAASLILLPIARAFSSEDSTGARIAFYVVLVALGVALLVGLWLLREGRPQPAAYILISVPVALVGLATPWLYFIPMIPALLVIVFGVIKGGLARELRPA